MPYYCYIIYSVEIDRYYTGHTDDIVKRLSQHNSGFSSFTSKADDWILVYKQEFETREHERTREMEIKKEK